MAVPTNAHQGGPSTRFARDSGFQARIRGASLPDLVQMECLAGAHRVVRVTSDDQVGYLYFREGEVVHAVLRLLAGETAALAMLAWSDGTFEPAEREWPARDSITCTWQSLVLRAAQISDERKADRVVPLQRDARPKPRAEAPAASEGESMEFDVTAMQVLQVAGQPLRLEDYALILRMNRDGGVRASHPGVEATQMFADIAAYALRLARLIGDQLGIERFAAMECTFKEGRCFIVVENDGDVVALKPETSTDTTALRERLGL